MTHRYFYNSFITDSCKLKTKYITARSMKRKPISLIFLSKRKIISLFPKYPSVFWGKSLYESLMKCYCWAAKICLRTLFFSAFHPFLLFCFLSLAFFFLFLFVFHLFSVKSKSSAIKIYWAGKNNDNYIFPIFFWSVRTEIC